MLDLLIAVAFQIINVNQTTPCFLNYSAGPDMWHNCGMDVDFLKSALLGFEWVTGGYFSLILVGVFTMISYIKYHKVIYPILIGIAFLPFSYFVFPQAFLNFGLIVFAVAMAALIIYAFLKQTKEY